MLIIVLIHERAILNDILHERFKNVRDLETIY